MYTIEDLKRCLILKLKKKYKDDKRYLVSLLEDSLINNYKTTYGDCLLNTFVFILKETKDKQTIELFINDLLKE